MTALKIGDIAPDFTLPKPDKSELSLSSLRGQNVLILFFPLAFTSTCTAELCGVRDDISRYNDMNAKVIGISVDSPFVLGKYAQENQLNMDLLSDFNKQVCGVYGSQYETFILGMQGVAKRSAFIVDKEGIIRYAEVLENAGDIPDFVKIKEVLSTL